MEALLALALTCQLSTISSPNYRAQLEGPNSQQQYALTLTYSFYGYEIDYDYVLTNNDGALLGTDKNGETVVVKDLSATSAREYSLLIESSKEGSLPMICENK